MKTEILTQALKKAIINCERVTRKTTTLPVLQNILLKTEGNFLELNTTNLETTIRYWVLSKNEKQGKVLVPANFLSNLITLIKGDRITLNEENKNLLLVAQNQENQIQGQDPEEFPIIPKIEKKDKYQISINKLISALSQIIDVPSISQIRPEISGVLFSFNKKQLKIVATDSFRLAEKTIHLEEEVKENISFILPQSTTRELINILTIEEGKIDIYLENNQVLFELMDEKANHSKLQILSRLIDGQYPNYQEIIPKSHTTTIQINKQEFENQVKQAGLFSGKVLEVKLKAVPDDNQIKLFSQSSDTGKNESTLSAQVQGEGFEVAFNYKFLLEGLNKIKSSEVILELSGTEGPGLLKPVGDPSYIYILMPIKAT